VKIIYKKFAWDSGPCARGPLDFAHPIAMPLAELDISVKY